MAGWLGEWMNELDGQGLDERTEFVDGWMDGWMSEWVQVDQWVDR